MNAVEAQRILVTHRPGVDDATDPVVREALALAASDPELRAWWRDWQEAHAALERTFKLLPVPPEPRERILAEAKTIRPTAWRQLVVRVAAVAAVLVVVFAVAFWPPPREATGFVDFRERMIRTVIREYRMDLNSTDETVIRGFLREHQRHDGFQLRPGLANVPLFGAGLLTWRGHPVSMVCFEREKDVLMYLFVIDSNRLPEPPGPGPEFAQVSHLATVSWSTNSQTYVLASDSGMEDLRRLWP